MPKDYVKIPLTKGKFAIVDIEDARDVFSHRWRLGKFRRQYYARMTVHRSDGKQTTMFLHSFIMPPPPGFEIDHIDGDGLNNRRSNLRLATRSQNFQNSRIRSTNTSGYKGVHWDKHAHKWRARIVLDGYNKNLGLFDNREEAAAMYDVAAIEYFGEFARLNGVVWLI